MRIGHLNSEHWKSPDKVNFIFIARSLDFSDRAGVKNSLKTPSEAKGVDIGAEEAVVDAIKDDETRTADKIAAEDVKKFSTSSQRLCEGN